MKCRPKRQRGKEGGHRGGPRGRPEDKRQREETKTILLSCSLSSCLLCVLCVLCGESSSSLAGASGFPSGGLLRRGGAKDQHPRTDERPRQRTRDDGGRAPPGGGPEE